LSKITRATKIGLLITLREGYLFCRNFLGLFLHPFKTIFVIFSQNDLSQATLIFGLPIYLFVFGFLFIKASRYILGLPSHPWGDVAKIAGIFLLFITFVLGSYLFFWFIKVLKSRKKWTLI
jgi:hypothetical protein